VVDGFRARYGHWPTRVRIYEGALLDFGYLFSARDMLTITAKVRLSLDDSPFIAEDDDGRTYSYGENSSGPTPRLGAREWFGVLPRPE
jgi:hypothetical protein